MNRKMYSVKPIKFHKKIDLVSHPAHVKGLVSTYLLILKKLFL